MVNKNLFSPSNFVTKNNVSITNDGIISSTGMASTNWGYPWRNWTGFLPAGTYQLSVFFSVLDTDIYPSIRVYDSSGTQLTIFDSLKNISQRTKILTLTEKTEIGIQFKLSDGICTFQIEPGSTASDYVPHAEQNAPLTLGNIELCKIGNYQDYLFKNVCTLRSGRANPLFNADLDEGDWYKYSAIGKVVLDGSENWIKRSDVNYTDIETFRDNDYIAGQVITNSQCFANYFKILTSQQEAEGIRLIDANSFGYQVQIRKTIASTAEELKTFFSTHNTTVYYPLKEPTYTKITDTALIAQLEAYYNSSTYRNVTNIITAGDDLAPIASIVYKKDLTTLFNKLDSLEARVDLLEE